MHIYCECYLTNTLLWISPTKPNYTTPPTSPQTAAESKQIQKKHKREKYIKIVYRNQKNNNKNRKIIMN